MKNKETVFTTLGASNHVPEEREKHDFYTTDPKAVIEFLKKLKQDNVKINNNIWECACGTGNISEVLKSYNYNVYSTDLIDRGYGEDFFNFLTTEKEFDGDILTNPPYKDALDFVNKSLSIVKNNNKVIMLLKIQFLETKSRYKLFMKNPPKYIYVYSSRIQCFKNNEKPKNSSALCYAWYIWEKGYNGETVVRWIPPVDK